MYIYIYIYILGALTLVQRWCRGACMVAAQVSPNDLQGGSQVAKAVQNACQKRGRGRPRRPKSQPEIDLGGLGAPRVVLGTLRARSGRPQEHPERHLGRHESHLGRQVGRLRSQDGAFGVQVGRLGHASERRRASRRFSVDFGVSRASSEVLKS